MRIRARSVALICSALTFTAVPRLLSAPPQEKDCVQQVVQTLKVSFCGDSSSLLFIEQGGRKYRIDVAARSIAEVSSAETAGQFVKTAFEQPGQTPQAPAQTTGLSSQPAAQTASQTAAPPGAPAASGQTLFQANCASCHGPDGKGIRSIGTPDFVSVAMNQTHVAETIRSGRPGKMPSFTGRLSDADITSISAYVASLGATAPDHKPEVYKTGDDVLFSLPTGRPVDAGGLYLNFSHRFPYDPAFQGPGRGGELFGLDDFSLSSLGLRYGVTSKFSVDLYRSPSFIGRPIELMAAYNLLSEQSSAPFNLTVRASVDGQNNFRKNYTENLEAIFSRSLTHRAQVYLVPTISFNDRRVVQGSLTSSGIPDYPGINAFSLGVGGAFDIRPTVALVAEVIPTLIGGDQLGIHRPAFSFGIQKKLFRHAFTFGVTTSPGTTVSQRAGTNATFLGNPQGDVFKEMFLGFDLTRQIH
jgi:mono/diheme cytochrome c family protein